MKLLGIDVLKGYLGCFGAKIHGFTTDDLETYKGDVSGYLRRRAGAIKEGNVILNTTNLYGSTGVWEGKLVIPLVSNFCFALRQPVVTRVWNDQIKTQIKNVDISFRISPTISNNALMEYSGISTKQISNTLENNPINKVLGVTADLNNIQNPFLLLVSTMLAKRQRLPLTRMNKGDTYYAWKLQTSNIIEEDLFLTNYIIDYQTGDVALNLTSYIAPTIRGQAEPSLYSMLTSGSGSS